MGGGGRGALMRCLSPFIQKCTHVFVHQLYKTQMLNGSESRHTSVGMLLDCVKINYIFQAIWNIENTRRHSLV